jgi:hypothetical protein
MEPKGSLLCSQEHITGSYAAPDEFIPHTPILLLFAINATF